MNNVCIPAEVFETAAYKALLFSDKLLLLTLYALFWDCQTFTVDLKTPRMYGVKDVGLLNQRVLTLLRVGLLKVVGYRCMSKSELGRPTRILEFTYKAEL